MPLTTTWSATHATIKRSMAITVIGCLFVGVFQDVIGLVHFFELGFCVRIVRVTVWVQFFGFRAVGLFQLFRGRAFGYT